MSFKNVDDARRSVRKVRGVHGAESRKNIADRSLFTEEASQKFAQENPVDRIPQSRSEYATEWVPVQIDGNERVLILPDIHVPYHDMSALKTALNYGANYKPTTVILNGDIIDFYACSRWDTDPDQRDLAGEVALTKSVLRVIRDMFPESRILYKLGNHEDRWEAYLRNKAPELLGVQDFKLKQVLDFQSFGIEEVGDARVIRIGTLNVFHGHEHKGSILTNPVNPARGMFLRAKCLSILSHFHQVSQHSERTAEGKIMSCWSTGCLCQLNPRYRPYNNWGHGFATVTLHDGEFEVENKRIIDGKVY